MKVSDLYESVTSRIVSDLEKGTIPWVQPWQNVHGGKVAFAPTNVSSGRPYTGINVLLLWLEAMDKDYPSHSWMTFRQANALGAKVRKGEKATIIVFTKWIDQEVEEGEKPKKKAMLKTYPVFNLSQLDNLPPQYQVRDEPPPADTVYENALRIMKECGIKVDYNGRKAAYYPQRDTVIMPPYSAFESDAEFFGVGFHELLHATGHKDRLNRNMSMKFGSEGYAMEELIAELGSAYLCAEVGIAPRHRSSSYVEGWLKALKSDKRAIFTAASFASQGADFIKKECHLVQENTPEVERQAPRETERETEMEDEIPY